MPEPIYENDESNEYRFALGEFGQRNLICVGLNPSIADSEEYDPTMKRVKKWAEILGYDGYVMVNLYPQRATDPSKMDDSSECNKQAADTNLKYISKLFGMGHFDVWAAWGANIGESRNGHLLGSLAKIWQAFEDRSGCPEAKWFHLGPLTKAGHPRHPLYISYSEKPTEFDVASYLKGLGR